MYDIINKHSPNMKINPSFDHQVHGMYKEEDALIDAIKTKKFRIILASLHLFQHIKNWKKLYKLAKENDLIQEVGALYDVARLFIKVRKISAIISKYNAKSKKYLIRNYENKDSLFKDIEKRWKVGFFSPGLS